MNRMHYTTCMGRRQFAAAATLGLRAMVGCNDRADRLDRSKAEGRSEPAAPKSPDDAQTSAPAAPTVARIAPSEPVDPQFAGCAKACGAKVAFSSADVIVQPGAEPGNLAHCPVSGAVFDMRGSSPRRVVPGKAAP